MHSTFEHHFQCMNVSIELSNPIVCHDNCNANINIIVIIILLL